MRKTGSCLLSVVELMDWDVFRDRDILSWITVWKDIS